MSTSIPLAQISKSSAKQYFETLNLLVSVVDGVLASRQDLDALIGSNPFSVAHSNHLNHARFLSMVMTYGAGDLLESTLPWVYRSYHAHGFSFDYFPVEIIAWKKAINDHLPLAVAQEILPLYDWMLGRHSATVSMALDRESEASSDGESPMVEPFIDAILKGDHHRASGIALEAVPTASALVAFYLDVIAPSMRRVGYFWEIGEITVAQEHLASATVGNVMAVLYSRILSRGKRKGVGVVTAVSGEFHEIGARMVADLLEADGWDIRYLGANTPAGDLARLCADTRAAVVALSVTMHFNIDAAAEFIACIREKSPETKILVGGRAFAGPLELWRAVGADGFSADASEAVAMADKWLKGSAGVFG